MSCLCVKLLPLWLAILHYFYLSVYLSIYLSVSLSLFLILFFNPYLSFASFTIFLSLSLSLTLTLSLSLSFSFSVCFFVPLCLSLFLSIYLSVSLSLSLSLSISHPLSYSRTYSPTLSLRLFLSLSLSFFLCFVLPLSLSLLHSAGANEKKFIKAEQELQKIGAYIDVLTENVVNSKNIKFYDGGDNVATLPNSPVPLNSSPPSPLPYPTSPHKSHPKGVKSSKEEWNNGSPSKTNINIDMSVSDTSNTINSLQASRRKMSHENMNGFNSINNKMELNNHITAEAICGFVTFEFSESMARAIEDSKLYSTFPFNFCFYPQKLKFRGQKLLVVKAPEPDEIVWENLEVSYLSKYFRRTRTGFVTFILLFVCFTVTLQASLYQGKKLFFYHFSSSY